MTDLRTSGEHVWNALQEYNRKHPVRRKSDADFLILGSIASGLIVVLLLVAPMVDAWLGRVLG